MAFSQLFRRYSTSNDVQSASYAYMDQNSIAETLLDELESQCRNCVTLISIHKRNSQVLNKSTGGLLPPGENFPAKRHASVDYSWLTPNNNLLQSAHDVYQLPDMIKMELSELIRYVSPEDCTLLINQFRRHVRAQTKCNTPENIIAIFRKTISDYIDQKPKHRSNETTTVVNKSPAKSSTSIAALVRNNRVNPKNQPDDEQHCIAELTEISISSSSNDGHESHPRSHSHA